MGFNEKIALILSIAFTLAYAYMLMKITYPEPIERVGQNITVLYSRSEPSEVMTPDNRESEGAVMMFIKLAVSAVIAFGTIFSVLYSFCKYGLGD